MKRNRCLCAALVLWAVCLVCAPAASAAAVAEAGNPALGTQHAALAAASAAAEGAALKAVVSDAVVDETGVDFTLSVSAVGPYEPCSAFEFALVSSDRASLFIRPLAEEDLDIVFAEDLGGVYHRGRDGAEPGSVSYLVGLYVKDGVNDISGDRTLCQIGLRYEGSEPRQIRLEQILRVRTDETGTVVNDPVSSVLVLDIGPEVFTGPVETVTAADAAAPLAVPPGTDAGPWPLVAGILAVLLAAAVVVIAVLSKRRPARPAPPDAGTA
ncbi:MAG: hypothetical protein LBC26_04790 [Oscillospiraceae bacterium]|nr:hypothetical protein [Oscillospiraceae bacterium]